MFIDDKLLAGGVVVVAAIVAILVAMAASLIFAPKQKTIELSASEWFCAKTEPRQYLQPMPVGKVTILMQMNSTICVQWVRK